MAPPVRDGDPLTRPGTAGDVAKAAPLETPARALLRPDVSPQQYLATLRQAGLMADAVRLLAFALPRREAVWWAAQCVRQVPAYTAGEPAAAALTAAETWAADPSDANRRAAFAAAETAGCDHPAGCAALAAFLAQGSMAPDHVEAVPPPPHAGPAMAANAVVLAALISEPHLAPDRYNAFLNLGDEVAAGTNRWKEAKSSPPVPATSPRPPAGPVPRSATPPPNRGWY